MNDKLKEVLKLAVEVAYNRDGDMSFENESDLATTTTDSMISLEIAIEDAFGMDCQEYRTIFSMIDNL